MKKYLFFKKYQFLPLKKLGQHFLINEAILEKIVKVAKISSKDVVLEIGAGFGNLTRKIAIKSKKVIAIEKDPRIIPLLKENLKEYSNVKIVKGDVLKIDFNLSEDYKIVANLPYYITSPVLELFLEKVKKKPKALFLTLQKEMAQRICANPPKMNSLAIFVKFYARPKIIFYISKNHFWPKPKVDSALVKIVPLCSIPFEDPKKFFKIVKAGFSHPRKQLINNLSEKLKLSKEKAKNWLLKAKIPPSKRAENLKIKDWIKLAKLDC